MYGRYEVCGGLRGGADFERTALARPEKSGCELDISGGLPAPDAFLI